MASREEKKVRAMIHLNPVAGVGRGQIDAADAYVFSNLYNRTKTSVNGNKYVVINTDDSSRVPFETDAKLGKIIGKKTLPLTMAAIGYPIGKAVSLSKNSYKVKVLGITLAESGVETGPALLAGALGGAGLAAIDRFVAPHVVSLIKMKARKEKINNILASNGLKCEDITDDTKRMKYIDKLKPDSSDLEIRNEYYIRSEHDKVEAKLNLINGVSGSSLHPHTHVNTMIKTLTETAERFAANEIDENNLRDLYFDTYHSILNDTKNGEKLSLDMQNSIGEECILQVKNLANTALKERAENYLKTLFLEGKFLGAGGSSVEPIIDEVEGSFFKQPEKINLNKFMTEPDYLKNHSIINGNGIRITDEKLLLAQAKALTAEYQTALPRANRTPIFSTLTAGAITAVKGTAHAAWWLGSNILNKLTGGRHGLIAKRNMFKEAYNSGDIDAQAAILSDLSDKQQRFVMKALNFKQTVEGREIIVDYKPLYKTSQTSSLYNKLAKQVGKDKETAVKSDLGLYKANINSEELAGINNEIRNILRSADEIIKEELKLQDDSALGANQNAATLKTAGEHKLTKAEVLKDPVEITIYKEVVKKVRRRFSIFRKKEVIETVPVATFSFSNKSALKYALPKIAEQVKRDGDVAALTISSGIGMPISLNPKNDYFKYNVEIAGEQFCIGNSRGKRYLYVEKNAADIVSQPAYEPYEETAGNNISAAAEDSYLGGPQQINEYGQKIREERKDQVYHQTQNEYENNTMGEFKEELERRMNEVDSMAIDEVERLVNEYNEQQEIEIERINETAALRKERIEELKEYISEIKAAEDYPSQEQAVAEIKIFDRIDYFTPIDEEIYLSADNFGDYITELTDKFNKIDGLTVILNPGTKLGERTNEPTIINTTEDKDIIGKVEEFYNNIVEKVDELEDIEPEEVDNVQELTETETKYEAESKNYITELTDPEFVNIGIETKLYKDDGVSVTTDVYNVNIEPVPVKYADEIKNILIEEYNESGRYEISEEQYKKIKEYHSEITDTNFTVNNEDDPEDTYEITITAPQNLTEKIITIFPELSIKPEMKEAPAITDDSEAAQAEENEKEEPKTDKTIDEIKPEDDNIIIETPTHVGLKWSGEFDKDGVVVYASMHDANNTALKLTQTSIFNIPNEEFYNELKKRVESYVIDNKDALFTGGVGDIISRRVYIEDDSSASAGDIENIALGGAGISDIVITGDEKLCEDIAKIASDVVIENITAEKKIKQDERSRLRTEKLNSFITDLEKISAEKNDDAIASVLIEKSADKEVEYFIQLNSGNFEKYMPDLISLMADVEDLQLIIYPSGRMLDEEIETLNITTGESFKEEAEKCYNKYLDILTAPEKTKDIILEPEIIEDKHAEQSALVRTLDKILEKKIEDEINNEQKLPDETVEPKQQARTESETHASEEKPFYVDEEGNTSQNPELIEIFKATIAERVKIEIDEIRKMFTEEMNLLKRELEITNNNVLISSEIVALNAENLRNEKVDSAVNEPDKQVEDKQITLTREIKGNIVALISIMNSESNFKAISENIKTKTEKLETIKELKYVEQALSNTYLKIEQTEIDKVKMEPLVKKVQSLSEAVRNGVSKDYDLTGKVIELKAAVDEVNNAKEFNSEKDELKKLLEADATGFREIKSELQLKLDKLEAKILNDGKKTEKKRSELLKLDKEVKLLADESKKIESEYRDNHTVRSELRKKYLQIKNDIYSKLYFESDNYVKKDGTLSGRRLNKAGEERALYKGKDPEKLAIKEGIFILYEQTNAAYSNLINKARAEADLKKATITEDKIREIVSKEIIKNEEKDNENKPVIIIRMEDMSSPEKVANIKEYLKTVKAAFTELKEVMHKYRTYTGVGIDTVEEIKDDIVSIMRLFYEHNSKLTAEERKELENIENRIRFKDGIKHARNSGQGVSAEEYTKKVSVGYLDNNKNTLPTAISIYENRANKLQELDMLNLPDSKSLINLTKHIVEMEKDALTVIKGKNNIDTRGINESILDTENGEFSNSPLLKRVTDVTAKAKKLLDQSSGSGQKDIPTDDEILNDDDIKPDK